MVKLLGVVMLRHVRPGSSIPAGAKGTVVEMFECTPQTVHMVEFCNDKGETFELLDLTADQIDLYWSAPAGS